MSGRERKPSDFQVFVDDAAQRFTWRSPDERVYGAPAAKGTFTYRPLLVLDPDDRKQMHRFAAALANSEGKHGKDYIEGDVSVMADAVRSLLEPPKPEEPSDPSVRVLARGIFWALVGSTWVSEAGDMWPWESLVDQRDFEVISPKDVTP